MAALGPEIAPEFLEAAHICNLAPHILGKGIWEIFSRRHFDDWEELQ